MRFCFLVFVFLFSTSVYALDYQFIFSIKKYASSKDYNYSWNPDTQTMSYQIGLNLFRADPFKQYSKFNLQAAKAAEILFLDAVESENLCNQITDWYFDYSPEQADYYLYLSMQGAACERTHLNGDLGSVRFRFLDIPGDQSLGSENYSIVIQ